jgi:4-hydroxyphenylpyruvate dioxygenase-like putative hemolysin
MNPTWITPCISQEASGPAENFISNFGPRVHHIAFQAEEIETNVEVLRKEGMKFLLDLVGIPEEELKQIFREHSKNSIPILEYINRHDDFDDFFTKSNVTSPTAETKAVKHKK